jgi:hypothetical protein
MLNVFSLTVHVFSAVYAWDAANLHRQSETRSNWLQLRPKKGGALVPNVDLMFVHHVFFKLE